MPSSPIHRFPLSDNSANNSFECETTINEHFKDVKSIDGIEKLEKCKLDPGNFLFRKHVQRPILLQTQRSHYRRRYTFSGHSDHKTLYKKRRRVASVAFPRKFLLGGNIKDPLNLRSLEDDDINQALNQFSPVHSPIPIPAWRSQVRIVIPQNIYDPLNLNAGDDIDFNLLSSKSRKRRRHRKVRKDDENVEDGTHISPTEEVPPDEESSISELLTELVDDCSVKEHKDDEMETEQSEDQDVISPVVAQGLPGRSVSRSLSRDTDSKLATPKLDEKQESSETGTGQNDTKLKTNSKKFCYGNHVRNYGDYGEYDQRIPLLRDEWFREKKVLDIGCNAGYLTLHIARHICPTKIIGLDIDKILVRIAQKKACLFTSEDAGSSDFPQSMATMYGPLAKIMRPFKPKTEFPHNVIFFQANYVPVSNECLEAVTPEFDTILCLRVTKWIQLNFGDQGLKMAFKKMYAQLQYGGHLILEPQPWFTYSTHKKLTPSIYETYTNLQLKPNSFCHYLLSEEVGFSSCQVVGRTYHKGYKQDLLLFTKEHNSDVSPIYCPSSPPPQSFHCDSWSEDPSEDFQNDLEAENITTNSSD